MNFFKTPFVFITPLFCLGILFGGSDMLFWLLLIGVTPLFLLLLFAKIRRKSTKQLFTFFGVLGIFFLGTLVYRGNVWNTDRLIDEYGRNEVSLLLDVLEIDDSSKEWRKAMCDVVASLEENELKPHKERIVIYFNSKVVNVNDRLLVVSSLFPIKNKGNLGEFDQETYWKVRGVSAMSFVSDFDFYFLSEQKTTIFDRSRVTITDYLNKVLEKHLSPKNQGIAKALILGDKKQLNPEVKESFSSAGAMHVLAVSGLHVGIILELFLFLFGRFPKYISRNSALMISVVLIWCYAGLIGFPPSVVRASLMFSLLILGRWFSRETNGLNTLLFSGFLMLCLNPMWLFDLGFQLSFLAMAGITLLAKPISQLFYLKNKLFSKVWEGTSVGIAAQLFTLPITLYYFHQFPNYFLITNVGMMVFAGTILCLGFLLFVTHFGGFVGVFVGTVLGGILTAMVLFVQFIEEMPGAVSLGFSIPFWLVISIYVILFGLLALKQVKWSLPLMVSLSFLLLIVVQIERYSAMNAQEITAFNFSKLAVGFKDKDQLIIAHDVNTEEKLDKLKFIIDAYRRVKPCNVVYHKLGKGITDIHLNSASFKITRWTNGFLLKNKATDKELFFRISVGTVPMIRENVIDMPYHGPDIFDRNLVHGSISMPFDY